MYRNQEGGGGGGDERACATGRIFFLPNNSFLKTPEKSLFSNVFGENVNKKFKYQYYYPKPFGTVLETCLFVCVCGGGGGGGGGGVVVIVKVDVCPVVGVTVVAKCFAICYYNYYSGSWTAR